MIEKDILNKAIQEIQTTHNLFEFISDIDSLDEALFQAKHSDISKLCDEHMQADNSKLVKELIKGMPEDTINTFLTKLVEALNTCPRFIMTLAFKPDPAFTKTLFDWVQTNVGEGYILDIVVEPDIIGGGIFVVNGLYKDYSLKKQLDKFFEGKDALKTIL